MILQYLFNDKTRFEQLEQIIIEISPYNDGDKATLPSITITNIEGSDSFIYQIFIDGNSLKLAKYLSQINEKLIELKPIILIDESSARFNTQLYPLINEFERKLRTMLYLRSVGTKHSKDISSLESLTFEKIYELLFTDPKFIDKMREIVNNKNKRSSQKYYIESIQSLPEDTLWDSLVRSPSLNFIKDRFLEIIDYRNDVMHAHNITYTIYYKAHQLFTQANLALQVELDLLIQSDGYRKHSQQELSRIISELLSQEVPDEIIDGLTYFTSFQSYNL